jgi:hypothetical protein
VAVQAHVAVDAEEHLRRVVLQQQRRHVVDGRNVR